MSGFLGRLNISALLWISLSFSHLSRVDAAYSTGFCGRLVSRLVQNTARLPFLNQITVDLSFSLTLAERAKRVNAAALSSDWDSKLESFRLAPKLLDDLAEVSQQGLRIPRWLTPSFSELWLDTFLAGLELSTQFLESKNHSTTETAGLTKILFAHLPKNGEVRQQIIEGEAFLPQLEIILSTMPRYRSEVQLPEQDVFSLGVDLTKHYQGTGLAERIRTLFAYTYFQTMGLTTRQLAFATSRSEATPTRVRPAPRKRHRRWKFFGRQAPASTRVTTVPKPQNDIKAKPGVPTLPSPFNRALRRKLRSGSTAAPSVGPNRTENPLAKTAAPSSVDDFEVALELHLRRPISTAAHEILLPIASMSEDAPARVAIRLADFWKLSLQWNWVNVTDVDLAQLTCLSFAVREQPDGLEYMFKILYQRIAETDLPASKRLELTMLAIKAIYDLRKQEVHIEETPADLGKFVDTFLALRREAKEGHDLSERGIFRLTMRAYARGMSVKDISSRLQSGRREPQILAPTN